MRPEIENPAPLAGGNRADGSSKAERSEYTATEADGQGAREMSDAEVVLFVLAEMDAEYDAIKGDVANGRHHGLGALFLAAHWLRIYCSEDSVKSCIAGIPLGYLLDNEMKAGRTLPPEIKAVRDEWYAGMVAYDMTLWPSQRTTPEGIEAARKERLAQKRRRRA